MTPFGRGLWGMGDSMLRRWWSPWPAVSAWSLRACMAGQGKQGSRAGPTIGVVFQAWLRAARHVEPGRPEGSGTSGAVGGGEDVARP
jgi:hypothetical protein